MKVLGWPAYRKPPWNPYTELLYRHVEARGVEVVESSPRRLLASRGAIVHVHWPEGVWNDRSVVRAATKAAAMLALLAFSRRRGGRVVWTVHNLEAHERLHPRAEQVFWRAFARRVDGLIALSGSGLAAARARHGPLARTPGFVAPIGHFRGVYADTVTPDEARARLGIPPGGPVVGFVGRVRPYKDVPGLVATFRAYRERHGRDAQLVVGGRVDDRGLADAIRAAAGDDASVTLHLRYIADEEMQLFLRAASLVVLPFREILNSASAVLALSFDRPVLVPEKGALPELRALVGEDWVRTYEGTLSPAILDEALEWAARPRPARAPLDVLDWDRIAEQTVAAYGAVLAGARG